MTAHTQIDERIIAQYQARQPRVTAVAVASGLIFAFILIIASYPLLVSAGLWLLGMALVFIVFAFVSFHRYAVPVWETALAGQVIGMAGIGLLLLASFVSV